MIGFSTAGIVPAGTLIHPSFAIAYGRTDATGRYRLAIPQADTFYIVAGFAEAPAFYTGGRNSVTPKTVILTPPGTIDALNIEIAMPAPIVGTAIVRGRVVHSDGTPAYNSTVTITKPLPTPMGVLGIRLPSAYPVPQVPVYLDGAFEFSNIIPGFYNARASLGNRHVYESFEVGADAAVDLKFMLPLP